MIQDQGTRRAGVHGKRRGRLVVLLGLSAFLILIAYGAAASRPDSQSSTDDSPVSAPNAGRAHTVSFEFPQNQIVFEAFFGDRGPFNLIVDTAVNPSVIDLSVARDLGLDIDESGATQAAGVGTDRIPVYPTVLTGLNIGAHEFSTFPAVAMDLRPFASRLGRPFHGALGYSFLRSRAVRIDYPAREITFYEGAAPPAPPRGTELPLELVGTDVLIDSVYLNGQPVRVTLDTGASLALTLSSRTATRTGLSDLYASATPGRVRGARGTAQVMKATADSLRVGGASAEAPEIAFAPWVPESGGLLGNGFLSHFILTVDYISKRLVLEVPTPGN